MASAEPNEATKAKMDFKATIDLVKYTLAVCAAGFVYTLEKLTPAATAFDRGFVLVLLLLFTASSAFGIWIFSSATAALHDPKREDGQRDLIGGLAKFHLGFLAAGILLLGFKLVATVMTEAPTPPAAVSEQAAAK